MTIIECNICGLTERDHHCRHQPITESAWERWFHRNPQHSPAMMGLRT